MGTKDLKNLRCEVEHGPMVGKDVEIIYTSIYLFIGTAPPIRGLKKVKQKQLAVCQPPNYTAL
jgi:hypothetical protein